MTVRVPYLTWRDGAECCLKMKKRKIQERFGKIKQQTHFGKEVN